MRTSFSVTLASPRYTRLNFKEHALSLRTAGLFAGHDATPTDLVPAQVVTEDFAILGPTEVLTHGTPPAERTTVW